MVSEPAVLDEVIAHTVDLALRWAQNHVPLAKNINGKVTSSVRLTRSDMF